MTLRTTRIFLGIHFLLAISTNLTGMEKNGAIQTITAQSIINNPLRCLTTMQTTQKLFMEELHLGIISNPKITALYTSLHEKFKRKCCLFLLDECSLGYNQDGVLFDCPLSRKVTNSLRPFFEKQASELLSNILKTNHNKAITTYTGFGSGNAFQDLVIITKALNNHPCSKLIIHLIDNDYKAYTDFLDCNKHSREIKNDQPFLNTKIKENQFCFNTNKTIINEFIHECMITEMQHQQMIVWIKQQFSNSNVSLYIHTTTQDYFNTIEKNNLPHADIITAADIDDASETITNSVKNYTDLCLTTLKAKKTSKNVWLKRDEHHIKVTEIYQPSCFSSYFY